MSRTRRLVILALTAWPLVHLAIRRPVAPADPWMRGALAEMFTTALLLSLAGFYAVRAWRSRRLFGLSRAMWAARSLLPMIQLLVAVPLAMAVVVVAVEGLLGWGIFDPSIGGDPVLVQHARWYDANRLSGAATIAVVASQIASWYVLVWRAPAAAAVRPALEGVTARHKPR